MPILNELSLLVRRQRAEMGLTQKQLAALSGLSRVTINQLETGRIANLSLVNAEQLDLRLNRQGLLQTLHNAMNRVADLSRLA